jgi:tetratricopeptide (TPR) repeat protein
VGWGAWAAAFVLAMVLAPARTLHAAEPARQVGVAATPDLLLDQGRRFFDALQYDQAVPVFDRLVSTLTAGGTVQRPELLVQAYELRGRAKFALGDSTSAEQDFAALLALNPSFKLPTGISPRIVALLDSVRRVMVGQAVLSLTPAGSVQIDGRAYTASADPAPVDLAVGQHQLSVTRDGYRAIEQPFTIVAGQSTPLALVLERISATLTLASRPSGVEVVVDDKPRGVTVASADPNLSAPFTVSDLAPGTHHLVLRRACYSTVERTITIERPEDLNADPMTLEPSVAHVKIETPVAGAAVFVDGEARGQAPADLPALCAGSHVIEVRGANGRFVDSRDWKAGDNVTLNAQLRSAFALVSVTGAGADTAAADRLRARVERALEPAAHVMLYSPSAPELASAAGAEPLPRDWLGVEAAATGAATPRVTRETRRDVGQRMAQKLNVQGVAAVAAGSDPNLVSVALLAAGSGEPDLLTIDLSDDASRGRAVALLGGALPTMLRPSIDASTIDVTGVSGAVVVRTAASPAGGLAVGDVIVSAGGTPVASVHDLRAKLATLRTAGTIALGVKAGAATRQVSMPVALVPETLGLRTDPAVLDNTLLLDLRRALDSASTPVERSAIRLNLAIVEMHLQNWDAALTELGQAQFAGTSGVSAGTVAYLMAVCFDALGRAPEAEAAFTKAAAATGARLSADGAFVAPLARARLQKR